MSVSAVNPPAREGFPDSVSDSRTGDEEGWEMSEPDQESNLWLALLRTSLP